MLVHLTARTAFGTRPFTDPRQAWWLWRRLRAHFPSALAACLMPDHLHLVLDLDLDIDVRRAKETLARVLAAARRHHPVQSWMRLPEPTPIADARYLLRQIRYVHLNPCRSDLVRDPLGWPWSTHRGLIGAEVEPWVAPAELATRFRRDAKDFARWFHAYVSSDPAVNVAGSAFPTSSPEVDQPVHTLAAIRIAALSATLWCAPLTRRQVLIQLARHQGWRNVSSLASSARTARRIAALPVDDELLTPARLCLGEPRLSLGAEQLAAILDAPRLRLDAA